LGAVAELKWSIHGREHAIRFEEYIRACHAPHWAQVSNVLESHLPTKAEGMNADALLTIDRPRIPHE